MHMIFFRMLKTITCRAKKIELDFLSKINFPIISKTFKSFFLLESDIFVIEVEVIDFIIML